MTTIEKMARAAYERMAQLVEAEFEATGDPFLDGEWDAQPQVLRDEWIESMRAAVEALKDPTEEMIHAAAETDTAASDNGLYRLPEAWDAMLDYVLNEKP